ILQSNIQTITLRQALSNINYHIIDESLIEENGHIYEIVVAEYGNQFMDDFDLKFGPILLRQKNNLFTKKWNRELQALEKIKRNLDEDKHFNRLNEINKEIKMVQEVIL
ncbi:tRNA methyltransferase, partial [Staphylococcus carnosus]